MCVAWWRGGGAPHRACGLMRHSPLSRARPAQFGALRLCFPAAQPGRSGAGLVGRLRPRPPAGGAVCRPRPKSAPSKGERASGGARAQAAPGQPPARLVPGRPMCVTAAAPRDRKGDAAALGDGVPHPVGLSAGVTKRRAAGWGAGATAGCADSAGRGDGFDAAVRAHVFSPRFVRRESRRAPATLCSRDRATFARLSVRNSKPPQGR